MGEVAMEFTVTATLLASPDAIYDAWMSTDGHTHMTGSPAVVDPRVGGLFVAWDGYITGKTASLESPRKIVQAWRCTDFEDSDPDSTIEVSIKAQGTGTKISIRHLDVPDARTDLRDGGWEESYFEPMRRYFGG
jgi:activator of HSP90 ATPase